MMKLGWGLVKRRDALWVQLMREKYKCGADILPRISSTKGSSEAWKGIRKAWDATRECVGWKLGDRTRVSFWDDCWLPHHDKLINYTSRNVDATMGSLKVSELLTASGGWDWDKFAHLLPLSVINSIARTYPSVPSGTADTPIWRPASNGVFSVKTAYQQLCSDNATTSNGAWRRIWKLHVPQRCKTFLWICRRGRLFTNLLRNARGLSSSGACYLCNGREEDTLHVLRDCFIAKECWELILPTQSNDKFFSISTPQTWIDWNVTQRFLVMGVEWRIWFAILSRQLWLNRNVGVFQGRAMSARQVVAQSRALTRWSKGELCREQIEGDNTTLWRAPYMGWIKYNTDGACAQNGALASCGGVAKDHKGEFQDGFMFNIGRGSSLHAEVWAVLWSLRRAWDLHWKKVVIETDCWELVELISSGWDDDHPEESLLLQVGEWLNKDWDVQIDWCGRESNIVADRLAKEVLQRASGLVVFSSPPEFICESLLHDVRT